MGDRIKGYLDTRRELRAMEKTEKVGFFKSLKNSKAIIEKRLALLFSDIEIFKELEKTYDAETAKRMRDKLEVEKRDIKEEYAKVGDKAKAFVEEIKDNNEMQEFLGESQNVLDDMATKVSIINSEEYAAKASGYKKINNKPYFDDNGGQTDVYISTTNNSNKKYWKNTDITSGVSIYTELSEEYLTEYERQHPSTINKFVKNTANGNIITEQDSDIINRRLILSHRRDNNLDKEEAEDNTQKKIFQNGYEKILSDNPDAPAFGSNIRKLSSDQTAASLENMNVDQTQEPPEYLPHNTKRLENIFESITLDSINYQLFKLNSDNANEVFYYLDRNRPTDKKYVRLNDNTLLLDTTE